MHSSEGFWARFRSEFARRFLGRGGAVLVGLGVAMVWHGVSSSTTGEWVTGLGIVALGYLALARIEGWWPFRDRTPAPH